MYVWWQNLTHQESKTERSSTQYSQQSPSTAHALGDTREKVHCRVLMLCWWYVHVHIWIVWFDGWNRLLFHICMSCLCWRDGWGNNTSSWNPLRFGWRHFADYCGALNHHDRVDMQLFSMQWCSDLALHSIASWQVVWHSSSDAWGCSWVDQQTAYGLCLF